MKVYDNERTMRREVFVNGDMKGWISRKLIDHLLTVRRGPFSGEFPKALEVAPGPWGTYKEDDDVR